MTAGLLDRERTALLVVDLQEGFRPAIDGFAFVAARAAVLVQAARILGLPITVSEQYPRGLGPTVIELAEHLQGIASIQKTVFSAARAEGFTLHGRTQALVCGIEAHICVSQTVHDLIEQGIEVHVAADAVSSRHQADRELGLGKMERAGASRTSTETALFELVGAAGSDEFKAIQKLIR